MGKEIRGTLMLALGAFIWGTSFVAQSVGMDYVEPATFNAARFLLGAVVLLPVILINSLSSGGQTRKTQADGAEKAAAEKAKKSLRLLLKSGIYCGAVLFGASLLQQTGIVYTTAGKAGFITALYIIVVPVLGLFFGKKILWFMWVCAFIARAGMYLLCIRESITPNKGDVLVLLCAFCYAVHILMIDYLAPIVDGTKLSCVQFFTCFVLNAIIALLFEVPSLDAIWAARGPVVFSGVLSCGVAYTLQIFGQRDVPPVVASLVMSLESVFAVLAGWFVLGEVLSAREISGCVLIFAAILLAQLPDFLKK
jgi:drug/metabolite transporter (DMT)-like permease